MGSGIVNGGFRLVQGGRFEHGFMSGFFTSLSGLGVGMIKTTPFGLYAVVGAATGGTTEALGGGKFAKGAVTGAFVGIYNHGWHGEKDGRLKFDNRDAAYFKIEELQKLMIIELVGYHLSSVTEDRSRENLYIVDTTILLCIPSWEYNKDV